MGNKSSKRHCKFVSATALALAAIGTPGVQAQEKIVSIDVQDDPWRTEVFYENDTRRRGKDATGKTVGLSKFRNTIQVEADKRLSDGWAFHGVLRGTYDGVYRLNKDQFGEDAGSKNASEVRLGNTAGPGAALAGLPPLHHGTTVPFGGGIGNTVVDAVQAGAGLPNLGGPGGGPGINQFVDPNYANPNAPPAQYGSGAGLRVLGDSWHGAGSGIAFAVPVRPCDSDKRGCTDFGGYGDKKLHELESPEFNSRLDFVREAFVKKTFTLSDGTDFFLKLGKQQVVWGRTDLFRVLDVINPVDYSRNNIYDELQDIRIPMWIAQGEWRMGASESMQERNLSFVWNFDQFRPHNLGQCGTANVMLDAGCFFRGMKNLWDNGGTVANFASFGPPGAPGDLNGTWLAANFGANQLGIRKVDLPEWSLANTQIGAKFEGVTAGGLSFSLNALHYRSQLPSLHAIPETKRVNPFTGASGNSSPFSGPAQGVPSTHMIAFDMKFPRVNLVGGSLDFQSEALGAAFRMEGAMTHGEEFVNTAKPKLYSSNRVFRSVIGVDRPTFIPFISESQATLFSAQLFYQHIFDHEEHTGLAGKVGMPDWENNVIGTFLVKAFLMNSRLSPQLIIARDFQARATTAAPQVEWSISDDLKVTFGANYKFKTGSSERWDWDDCRSCNPYAPYTTYAGQTMASGSAGLSGMEPLGRFRAGPIGSAWKEDEIYIGLRYKF